MKVKISSKMKKEVLDFLKDFGYKSEKEFVEDAILHWILESRKKIWFFWWELKKLKKQWEKKELLRKKF